MKEKFHFLHPQKCLEFIRLTTPNARGNEEPVEFTRSWEGIPWHIIFKKEAKTLLTKLNTTTSQQGHT